jgi:hypothetical protein
VARQVGAQIRESTHHFTTDGAGLRTVQGVLGPKARIGEGVGHVFADRERFVDRSVVNTQYWEQAMHAAERATVGKRCGLDLRHVDRAAGEIRLFLHVREFNGFLAERRTRMREGEPRAHGPRRIAQAQDGKVKVRHIEQGIPLQDKFKRRIILIPNGVPALIAMKKALVVPALLIVAALVYLIQNHANYGDALPPGLPSDISIVEGKIISGRRALFEDGRGYVLDMQSDLPYREVVEFYADRYGNDPIVAAPGMGAEFSTAAFRVGSKKILLEIHSREAKTYVTMAIHLGRWW